MMVFRRIRVADLGAVLELQEQNLFWNMDEGRKRGGFLSTAFDAGQFLEMDQSGGIAICEDDGVIVGYGCVSTPDMHCAPLWKALAQQLPQIKYRGMPLSQFRILFYGPVCIDHRRRGREVIEGLFQKTHEFRPPGYQLAVGFVAQTNLRAQQAFARLGFARIQIVSLENSYFWVVVYELCG